MAGSGVAAARRDARPGGLHPALTLGQGAAGVRGADPWGAALGTATAPGSGGRTAEVKSRPCQLIHLCRSQAGPGGSAGFGSCKWVGGGCNSGEQDSLAKNLYKKKIILKFLAEKLV